MNFRQIGKSGLITSDITLGTMIFGEKSGRSTPEKEALHIIDQYIDQGGNHVDTADIYADGQAETIIGKALTGKRKDVVLATKVRHRTGVNPNAEGLSRHNIIEGVESSLRRLRTDYIDLLYIHCFDPITPFEETILALEDMIRSGKVRYIGVSNFKAWQLMKILHLSDVLKANSFIAAQYQYSLVRRDIDHEFMDIFKYEGLGLLPWGPLGGGFLTGKYDKSKPTVGRISNSDATSEEAWERRNLDKNWLIVDELKQLAKVYGATPSQIAIAWLLAKEAVSSVVIGPRTLNQLKDNMGATHIKLAANDFKALNNLSALEEMYPYRFIEQYGQRNLSELKR
ncbi:MULTISPECIES: aldo/keto reductase [Flavobacteriaceae]|uniref:aldo/keto reductase n=1 Tax=Flavobacteriaceae TaxID=49546 RepID=UPI001490B548|nr:MULTISPECIES: aldo/keto reductase [Allomuricauda]MDC6365725.1 aldo/keto reductase [Muricauda sp. AC10]